MFFLVFSFVIVDAVSYDISHGYNIFEHNDLGYILGYFMISLPTFIGSIIGVSVRNGISKLKNKYFN